MDIRWLACNLSYKTQLLFVIEHVIETEFENTNESDENILNQKVTFTLMV